MHDILGNYNRFDIFDLRINTKKQEAISFEEKSESERYSGEITEENE